jgi:hypothetical protein
MLEAAYIDLGVVRAELGTLQLYATGMDVAQTPSLIRSKPIYTTHTVLEG